VSNLVQEVGKLNQSIPNLKEDSIILEKPSSNKNEMIKS
jgi:hypothetical protein